MKHLKSFLSSLLLLVLIACGGGEVDYDLDDLDSDYMPEVTLNIDNGTDTTANVIITPEDKDTTYEFTIEGQGLESVMVPVGEYHVKAVTVTDSLIVDKDFELDDDGYVYSFNLNLTREDYIVENIEYIVGGDGSQIVSKTFTYKGKTYEGIDAEVIEGQLVVPDQWDYNLDEESPDEVTLYDGQNSTVKRKLYRASTFILYLELIELFEQYGSEEQ